MSAQIFISYRRVGGDVTAKLICETLKNRGYTVFYDFDAIKGGFFDTRILQTIEGCKDVIVVLPKDGLERCADETDWVRQEIRHAIRQGKNISPVMMNGFEFPSTLPDDIDQIRRYNGVRFIMDYFDAVMDKIVERLVSVPYTTPKNPNPDPNPPQTAKSKPGVKSPTPAPQGQLIVTRRSALFCIVRNVKITIDGRTIGSIGNGQQMTFPLRAGVHKVCFSIDWLRKEITVTPTAMHPTVTVDLFFKTGWTNSLEAIVQP